MSKSIRPLGAPDETLRKWTAQETAPAFVYNDERPRSIWSDQLYLAERISPSPALIPPNIDERMRMFGLANELCGEDGLGWARRLMLLHDSQSNPNLPEAAKKFSDYMGRKYGYGPASAAAAPARVAALVTSFARQLATQRERGCRYLDRRAALRPRYLLGLLCGSAPTALRGSLRYAAKLSTNVRV
jgi:hypothetical protein